MGAQDQGQQGGRHGEREGHDEAAAEQARLHRILLSAGGRFRLTLVAPRPRRGG
jgi:hypothetical protein